MTYYIEYIFLENFAIDFILVYVTGSLLKQKFKIRRLLVASIIGAAYVLIIAIFNQRFLSTTIVKLCVSILMITVAYNPKRISDYIRLTLCFYIISFLIVGMLIATNYFFSEKGTVTLKIIFEASLVTIIILKAIFEEVKRKTTLSEYIKLIVIEINNKTIRINGLIDTGNELIDSLTHKPVIVVEIDSICKLLKTETIENIKKFYSNEEKSYLDIFMKSETGINFTLIQYNTISSKGESMLGIIPSKILIANDHKALEPINAIVGIYPNKLNTKNEYQALLHKDLLELESEI